MTATPAGRTPTVADFASTGRTELTEAVRDLVDATMTVEDVDDDALLAAARAVRKVVEVLDPDAPVPHRGRRTRFEADQSDYIHRSVVVGRTNPVAPPGWERAVTPDELVARGTFTAPYEGPSGLAHGGWIALVFDEFLGMFNAHHGEQALTGTLSVRYRRPTPLHRPTVVTVRREALTARTITNRATLECDGSVTAEATGVFVRTE